MNEPGGEGRPDASRWLATNRRIIEAVRDEGGSSNVVLVEGASWGQDAGGAGEDRVLKRNSAILAHGKELLSRSDGNPYGNVGFSIHVYEEWNGGDERLADYLDRAAKKGLALVVGEYGTDNGEDRSTVDATASLFRVATPRGVGPASRGTGTQTPRTSSRTLAARAAGGRSTTARRLTTLAGWAASPGMTPTRLRKGAIREALVHPHSHVPCRV